MATSKSKKPSGLVGGNLLKRKSKVSIYAIAAIVVMLSGIGIYLKFFSHASVNYLTYSGCTTLRGRNWVGGKGNPCGTRCAPGSGTLITTNVTYNYCSNTETKASLITKQQCINVGRVWLFDGCAKRFDQRTTTGAAQCSDPRATYYAKSPNDICIAAVASASVAASPYTLTCTTTFTTRSVAKVGYYVTPTVVFHNSGGSALPNSNYYEADLQANQGPDYYQSSNSKVIGSKALTVIPPNGTYLWKPGEFGPYTNFGTMLEAHFSYSRIKGSGILGSGGCSGTWGTITRTNPNGTAR